MIFLEHQPQIYSYLLKYNLNLLLDVYIWYITDNITYVL